MAIDWMIVKDSWNKKPIGAVGFLDEQIVTIVSFFEDKDFNEDGEVNMFERFGALFTMRGRAVAKVAAQAYADPDILMRDPTLTHWRGKLLTEFAAGMVVEGAYKAWFSIGVGQAAGAVAGAITQNAIKSFVIKKGMEMAVKEAYMEAMDQ